MPNSNKKINAELIDLSGKTIEASYIDPNLYKEYDVKRGLRDINGEGVLVGITNISEVNSRRLIDGKKVPIDGELFYRGYNIKDIIKNQPFDFHFGFEDCAYLLLFGSLPSKKQLDEFCDILAGYRTLPKNFVRDVILKKPSRDMMNSLSRSVLSLYSYDDNPDDTSEVNCLRQCLSLIAMFPLLSVYGYNSYRYYWKGESLIIHPPKKNYSTAENILHCLRDDSSFTPLEAKLLDVALILHMEHGGGNNSTFTTHLVSSSGSDTYSVIAAALGSLKGPRHGGANIKVMNMMADIRKHVTDYTDEEEVGAYLKKLLHKEAFDNAGLIYGIGHAIYSLSDPRAITFKGFVEEMVHAKGYEKEYSLYQTVERIAPKIISSERKVYKGVCPNIDFYSGFVYHMLGLPVELFTPIFAIARIAGWAAHRMEEVCHHDKIMRPAYMTVAPHREYIPLSLRKEQ